MEIGPKFNTELSRKHPSSYGFRFLNPFSSFPRNTRDSNTPKPVSKPEAPEAEVFELESIPSLSRVSKKVIYAYPQRTFLHMKVFVLLLQVSELYSRIYSRLYWDLICNERGLLYCDAWSHMVLFGYRRCCLDVRRKSQFLYLFSFVLAADS